MAGLAGKWMRLTKSATNYKVTRCRSNLRTQMLETTNSESGPNASGGIVAEEYVFGVYGGDVDVDVTYQISDALLADIGNGTTNSVTFRPDKSASGSTLVGSLMVETFELTGEVKGLMSAKITGKFSGGWTGTAI